MRTSPMEQLIARTQRAVADRRRREYEAQREAERARHALMFEAVRTYFRVLAGYDLLFAKTFVEGEVVDVGHPHYAALVAASRHVAEAYYAAVAFGWQIDDQAKTATTPSGAFIDCNRL